MLRLCQIALGIALLLALPDNSQSQQPSPSPGGEGQPPQSQSAQPAKESESNQRGTENAPFIVKILPAPETKQEPAASNRDEFDKASSDKKIADFTELLFWATVALSVIAAFQLFVFSWQGIQLRNAVKASRDEFLASHRPKIRIKHLVFAKEILPQEPIIVHLTCVNHGTSEATLSEIGIKYFVVPDKLLPPPTGIDAIPNLGIVGGRLPCGYNWETKCINANKILTQQDHDDIQMERAKLYCVGFVSYHDDAKRLRITGFCRVLTFQPGQLAFQSNSRFRRFRDPDYEYED
jgi:hypothetical protein